MKGVWNCDGAVEVCVRSRESTGSKRRLVIGYSHEIILLNRGRKLEFKRVHIYYHVLRNAGRQASSEVLEAFAPLPDQPTSKSDIPP